VVEPGNLPVPLTDRLVQWICDRHYGAGSDGLLVGPLENDLENFSLGIYNPDGSAAEKSGNGLRIFARYLWDLGRVKEYPFTVITLSGPVLCQVLPGGGAVRVEMGKASFDSRDIPVTGPPRKVIQETILVAGEKLDFCSVSLGNPHSVILCNQVSAEQAWMFGPLVERHSFFPRRTNVQFLQVIDRANLRIEIWERGAGYTLASGSSACAAASVAHYLGLCEPLIWVHMPGGALQVCIAPDGMITLVGPVARVYTGSLDLAGLAEYQYKGVQP
jgi:diaminopimelate epimerase